jgi:hypothetical protein
MALDKQIWTQLHRIFDPTVRLEAGDRDLFVERPGSVADDIARDLDLGLDPEGKWIVCGSMGSGKSTELLHLLDRLQGERVVVGLDLPRSVARVDLLRPAELLFLIGAAAAQVRASWGQAMDTALLNDLLGAFKGLVGDKDRVLNVADMIQGVTLLAVSTVPGGAAFAGAASGAARALAGAVGDKVKLRRPTQLGGLTRSVSETEPDLDRLREAVDAILASLANDRPPVVLVDGLDKIQDRTAIQQLFTQTRILAMPRAQMVYTGPITLMLSTDWHAASGSFKRARLNNVAIGRPALAWVDVSDEKIQAGRDAMAEIIGRRLRKLGLQEQEVFGEGALAQLVDASGGLVRDLIHLVNRSVRLALRGADHIDRRVAAEAVMEYQREFAITLTTRMYDELRHVREHGEPSGRDDVSAELLLKGYVLPYSNGKPWFEPHPILRGLRPGI